MTDNLDKLLVLGRGVSRAFGQDGQNFEALRHVSFQIAPGDQIALVGRSGSGKSTLLNMIAGLDRPTQGDVVWPLLGDPDTLRPRQISVMFQSLSLVPTLTVLENTALPLDLLPETSNRADLSLAALELFGLGELANKLPEELSGGQAQRVSLARATVTRPRLLIADEPTGQIDHVTGQAVVSALRNWANACGAALLIATHDTEVSNQFPIGWHLAHGKISTQQEHVLQ